MGYTFAVAPSDVYTDQRGVPVAGQQIGVWTAETGGQAATGLVGTDGADLPDGTTITDGQGRYGFTTPDQQLGPVLWLDDGRDRRWPVVAVEQAAHAFGYIGQVSEAYRGATVAAEQAEQSARAAARTGDAGELAEQAESDIDTLASQTVTLDELFVSAYVPAWVSASGTISATVPGSGSGVWQTVFIAPFALRLHQVVVAWEYWGVEASNSAYWEFAVSRMHWHGDIRDWDNIGSNTTQLSGDNAGGAMKARTTRVIEPDQDVTFSIDDLMLVGFIPHGTPAAMNYSVSITASYSPV